MPPDHLRNNHAPDGAAALLEAARAALHTARVAINREIGAYPAPIPACDAQFNGLLEQRRQLSRAIRGINDLLAEGEAKTLTGVELQKILDALSPVDGTLAGRLKTIRITDPFKTPIPR